MSQQWPGTFKIWTLRRMLRIYWTIRKTAAKVIRFASTIISLFHTMQKSILGISWDMITRLAGEHCWMQAGNEEIKNAMEWQHQRVSSILLLRTETYGGSWPVTSKSTSACKLTQLVKFKRFLWLTICFCNSYVVPCACIILLRNDNRHITSPIHISKCRWPFNIEMTFLSTRTFI